MAGKLGCGGGPLILFSPPRACEAMVLKEGRGNHCHEGVTMEAMPGSSLEVIEPEFFLQLLVRLLTDPARLDGADKHLERRVTRQVRKVIFALAAGATFADQPYLVAGHMLATHVADALPRPISDPHTHSGKACRQSTFCAAAPADRAPRRASKHGLRRDRFAVGDVSPPWTAATCYRKDQCHITSIDLLMPRDTDSPL